MTIVDCETSPPKLAAAIDFNRIIRTDYPCALHCDLAYEAIHSWFWSPELGHHFRRVGWLMLNEEGSDIRERVNATFPNRGSNCAEIGLLPEIETRWNGDLRGTDVAGLDDCYFNRELGWANAAGAIESFMAAAVKRGINRVTAEVAELLLDRSENRVKGVRLANGQTLAADKIVLATDAWTSALLSPIEDVLDIPEPDRIECQVKATGTVSAYYKVSDTEIEQLTKAGTPVIVYGGFGEVISPSNQNRLMEYSNTRTMFTNTITTRSGHRISVPRVDQSIVPESLMRETETLMASRVVPQFTRGKKPE